MDSVAAVLNGIDGVSGSYFTPPLPLEQVAALARGPSVDEGHLRELHWWRDHMNQAAYAPPDWVDPRDLAATGWGVIFARDADPEIRQALDELLSHRRRQAARVREPRYRELSGDSGYRPGESKYEFLARQRMGPGPVDPDRLPYYLLIVGDPETIPYSFQYQLDVQYAVGRIHFDRPENYAAYARAVVRAETDPAVRPRRLALFATTNPDDPATAASSTELVAPLAERLAARYRQLSVDTYIGEAATKERLLGLLGGPETPSLLFTASHGVAFPRGDPLQSRHQGALLCQEWPGPTRWRGRIPDMHFVSADDIGTYANLGGLIAFHFACFGAGTPRWDHYAHALDLVPELASRAFVAALPMRLLGHEQGGVLAVVGHVDRAWSYSFLWPGAGSQTEVYEACLARLLDGHPIGSAFEFFNTRYAELSTDLSAHIEQQRLRRAPNRLTLAGLWTATNDARDLVVLGDPAVRLPTEAGFAHAGPPDGGDTS